jgi:hypothetical protein
MIVPTGGMLGDVKYPLPSNVVTLLALVTFLNTEVVLVTGPLVHAKPRIVIGFKPTLLMMNVLSLPDSCAAEPTTIPSKSTCSGFIVMNGAELILMPVKVTGCEVANPVFPLTVRSSIEVVCTPGTTDGELVLPELS